MTFMAEMTIKKRPKNLDLTNIRLPLAGKLSILHRVSGAGLFLFLPVLLWLLQSSLTSPETFALFKSVLALWPAKVVAAGLAWAYCHHFCAGIRFLLLDFHIGLDKESARKSAAISFVVSIALAVLVIWRVVL
jgi:succinate dehydrogenase / fumarate reductase, cytochrome b subunit